MNHFDRHGYSYYYRYCDSGLCDARNRFCRLCQVTRRPDTGGRVFCCGKPR